MERPGRQLLRLLLACWAALCLFPLFWMFFTSFVRPEKITAGSLTLATSLDDFSLANYRALFAHASMGRWFINSVLVCAVITLLHLLFDSLAGYAFAKKKFRGRSLVFGLIVATMMIPGQVLMVPLFILLSRMGLVDTLTAVVLPALAGPFGIFMMRQHIKSIPDELLDAARIDGCSEARIFFSIILPLSAPMLATLGIFVFVTHWNAYLWPLIVLYSNDVYTLPVGLATLQGKHTVNYGLLMAGASLAALPMLVAFICFSRAFVKGLTAGAVKG